jgi:hypothetical protein
VDYPTRHYDQGVENMSLTDHARYELTRPDDSVRTIAIDSRHAALVRRFWAPTMLRLPYPRMNVVALAEVMCVTSGRVGQRCLAGTMPFPVAFEDGQWFADRVDVAAWYVATHEEQEAA